MSELPINWKNKNLEKIFTDIKINTPEDFMNIETCTDELQLQSMRDHKDKTTGEINRKMTSITVNDKIFFLKRAYGNALKNIENELAAIKILPEFGLKPCEVAAHWFDREQKQGFLLLENLDGFYSIKDIIKKIAPKDVQEDFKKNQDSVFYRIAEAIRNVHKKGFIYPDWFAKHIYFKKGAEELALIDLERFRNLDDCPWYFSFPVTSGFVRRKVFKKLRISLLRDSDCLTEKYLEGILHE